MTAHDFANHGLSRVRLANSPTWGYSNFDDWICQRCGARQAWYENGRSMKDGALEDCDDELVRQVMLS